mmetsp:Transcript_54623/g.153375  ORF Transcript_54623/g.153375 Transcript_54623/m.153375 type:complete len:250 (-) Transcript_54623:416-1165(-)
MDAPGALQPDGGAHRRDPADVFGRDDALPVPPQVPEIPAHLLVDVALHGRSKDRGLVRAHDGSLHAGGRCLCRCLRNRRLRALLVLDESNLEGHVVLLQHRAQVVERREEHRAWRRLGRLLGRARARGDPGADALTADHDGEALGGDNECRHEALAKQHLEAAVRLIPLLHLPQCRPVLLRGQGAIAVRRQHRAVVLVPDEGGGDALHPARGLLGHLQELGQALPADLQHGIPHRRTASGVGACRDLTP